MTQPILTTKLSKPQLPAPLIAKPKILKALTIARLNIISAQAGSGKSTAVSHWLTTQNTPYIWYALDDWDNDLSQFLTYIAFGLKTIDHDISQQLEQLTNARTTLGDDALTKAAVQMLHALKRPYTLVLDDYHLIKEETIHQLMRAIISHFPQHLHLCVITREDPPFATAKLRTQGLYSAIRRTDLNLTFEETTDFFGMNIESLLNNEQLTYLYQRTEGWIAGLQLTALSLSGAEDVDGFIDAFSKSHYYIMDYLLEEVLEKHTDTMRNFILQSSVFEFFSAALCDDALGLAPGESQNHINYLLKTNSFLIALEGWYRYHHLFRELLRERIKPSDKEAICQRAGDWYKQKGHVQEAIEMYLQGGQYGQAAALIEAKWATMDLELKSYSWMEMAKKLPSAVIEMSPVLSMGIGWALLDGGDTERCLPWFQRAEALYQRYHDEFDKSDDIAITDHAEFEQLPVTLMSAYAYIDAVKGDYSGLFDKIQLLRELSTQHFNKKQWLIDTFVATYHWGRGDLDEAIVHLKKVRETSRMTLNPLVQNSLLWVLAELYIQKGALSKAEMLIVTAIDEVHREGIVPVLLATYHLYLALIACYRGERETAFEWLEKSRFYGHQFEYMNWGQKFNTLKARLHLQGGEWNLAQACIKEGQRNVFLNPIPESFSLEDMSLWLAFKREPKGHIIGARVDEWLAQVVAEAIPYTDEMRWKLVIKWRRDQGLEHICSVLFERAKRQERWLNVIELALLMRQFAKNEEERDALYRYALSLSEKEGIRGPFIEFDDKVEASALLTARELEMLKWIEKGASNQEIAEALFIAVSTVKSYNNSLFCKLEVKRRTEAVAKAKAMGLL